MKFSPKERERRTDAALAEGRYRITGHYSANDNNGAVVEVVNLFLCNVVNGRCEVCGARPIGPLRSGPEPKQLPAEDDATYWKRFERWNRESIEELERAGPEHEGCFSTTVSGRPGLLAILEDRAKAEKAT